MGVLQMHAFAQLPTALLSTADSSSGCIHVLDEELMWSE